MNDSRSVRWPFAGLVFVGVCALAASGCSYFRTLGSGTHLDQPQTAPHELNHQARLMVVEVTTDAQGQIASIHFVRSSGKEGIDGYVEESIRQGWPQQPSKRTVVEVTYSGDKGFSPPKVVSSVPVS